MLLSYGHGGNAQPRCGRLVAYVPLEEPAGQLPRHPIVGRHGKSSHLPFVFQSNKREATYFARLLGVVTKNKR